jgi:hypothetical protein
MTHYMASEDGLSFEEVFPPEPGERCAMCNRRRNKPRTDESPPTKQIRFTLPAERKEWAEEALDALQEVVGADPYSYPRGSILEALLLLGGQEREELKRYFNGDRGAL